MVVETLEPHLVETLKSSACKILESMVSLTPSSAEVRTVDYDAFSDEIIGMLSFTGTKSGTLFVRTSSELATLMAAKMLMIEPSDLESFADTADAFGEIVNMLAGNFKNEWVADGKQMELSIPHVVRSGNMHFKSASITGLRSCVRLDIDGQHVDIVVHLKASQGHNGES